MDGSVYLLVSQKSDKVETLFYGGALNCQFLLAFSLGPDNFPEHQSKFMDRVGFKRSNQDCGT